MKNRSLFLLIIILASSCAITRDGERRIKSKYHRSTTVIAEAYTSFYNEKLNISEDLYAIYSQVSDSCHKIDRSDFYLHKGLVQKLLKIELKKSNFLFEIRSADSTNITTQIYYIPKLYKNSTPIKGHIYNDRYYNIYCLSNNRGTIVQLFSIKDSKRDISYNQDYNNECDAIIQKLCYKDYYKRAYVGGNKIAIDYSNSSDKDMPIIGNLSKGIKLDTLDGNRVVAITPARRDELTIDIKFPDKVKSLIRENRELNLYIYFADDVRANKFDNCIIKKRLYSNTTSLVLNSSYDDYLLIIADENENVYDALNLGIW